MNIIDGKKIYSLLILFVFCFANSTCKRISKYPVDMIGEWAGSYYDCGCGLMMEINRNNTGKLYNYETPKGCNVLRFGRVRYNHTHLYIGVTAFKFVAKPEIPSGNDTIEIRLKKYKVLAKMVLESQAEKYETCRTTTYYKIKEY